MEWKKRWMGTLLAAFVVFGIPAAGFAAPPEETLETAAREAAVPADARTDAGVPDTSAAAEETAAPDVSVTGPDTVYAGKTIQLTAHVKQDVAGELKWEISSANALKARVDGNGAVTGISRGVLKVYATYTTAGGAVGKASHTISVKRAMTRFSIVSKENRNTLYKGGNGAAGFPWHTQLVLSNVWPQNASKSVRDVTWRSSDPRVATVVNGKVQVARGAGSRLGMAAITATDKGGGVMTFYRIKVTKAAS
jgi:hypothetical protein